MVDLQKEYLGKKVLIIGGLGFIGSNLAEKLVQLGAKVSIMDPKLPLYGGNLFNIAHFRDKINLDYGDVRDCDAIRRNILGQDIIFNLAAQIDHNYSMQDPSLDIDLNCKGHINVLEECRKNNPNCRIIFPGSRMQYGKISDKDLPVNENHPLNPLSVYAVNKTTGELYYKAYHNHHKMDTVVLRISNPFGPKAQIKHSGYCIVNWFIRQALEGKEISIFGDGSQLRDYIFIDDLVEAMLIIGVHPNARGKVYNLGSGKGIKFKDMVNGVVELTNSGSIKTIPWPENYENVETGNYYSDISKIHFDTSWLPKTSFEEGLKKTIEFYKQNLEKYI
jgi:UDP-glucose 4-epimerase